MPSEAKCERCLLWAFLVHACCLHFKLQNMPVRLHWMLF